MKLPGILGMILALIIPVLGNVQATLLIGNFHWLIQATHLLIGVVAVATTQMLGKRYEQFKQATAKVREFAQN
jgi:flagellar motor component MotA